MKIGNIVKPNQKGQVVIPQKMRKELGIDQNTTLNMVLKDKSICIYPIADVIPTTRSEDSYSKILDRTRGTWAGDDWEKTERKRRKMELEASQKRKKAW